MLERILRVAGYKTGLYTSPHLHTYRERIRVNGELITPQAFAAGLDEIRPLLPTLVEANPEFESVSTFEVMTSLALAHFARQQVQVAILEVGLGGRLDATNVVDADLSLVTPVSMDHMAVLGDSLGKIAFEKAGIIKPGRPVLSAAQLPIASRVLEQAAHERDAPIGIAGRDWLWLGDHDDFTVAAEARPGLWESSWQSNHLCVPLRGVHQLANASLAVAAAHVAQNAWTWSVAPRAIQEGLAAVEWAGRIQVVQERTASRAWIVVDGAHNGDSAEKLAAALEFHFQFEKLWLIVGVLNDKHLEAIIAPFLPRTRFAWTVKTDHPRSRDAESTAAALNALGLAAAPVVHLDKALEEAQAQASPRDLICITGSLSLAAQALRSFGFAPDQDPP
jgi:dihydrofolate synthase/folylpolyglutamate synthase